MDQKEKSWCHLCIDMQCMFADETPWHVPWMSRVLPVIEELSGRFKDRTIFTRFVPPETAAGVAGMWQAYYRKWWMMTREHIEPGMIDLVPSLVNFAPPAVVFDKATYSPWLDGRLHAHLQSRHISTVAVSGGETDVCVLATVLGAIDLGYRTVLLSDAICSGADETHDAVLKLLNDRFSVQVEICSTVDWLSAQQDIAERPCSGSSVRSRSLRSDYC